ncbi:GNAT family N-acetyltransferase (plasmid) [Moritella sp. 24]|uniref:GNAT family N-acetyltransferase n=1 Tax=Moritella sp. 24 TaxID=2746230 RepID=UPI001BAD275C|nr:GNAT family N-acetyltransferase [Moritella sp. 24]QUM78806.1 GNAT family N-acetyltransferase [Moritella sp. 24]
MKIEIINEENEIVFDALVSGVREHNFESMGTEKSIPLSVVAKNDNNEVIAGVSGRTIYKNFLIEVVWVDKKLRGTGLGRKLMAIAEVEAMKRECVIAQVDTLSFQAPIFYEKQGFKIIGKVPSFFETPERYFMMKTFI